MVLGCVATGFTTLKDKISPLGAPCAPLIAGLLAVRMAHPTSALRWGFKTSKHKKQQLF
jgi:hypothetical protein